MFPELVRIGVSRDTFYRYQEFTESGNVAQEGIQLNDQQIVALEPKYEDDVA